MTDVSPEFLELPKNLHGCGKIAEKSTKKISLTWRVYDAHTGNRNVNQARELDVSKNKKKRLPLDFYVQLVSGNTIMIMVVPQIILANVCMMSKIWPIKCMHLKK